MKLEEGWRKAGERGRWGEESEWLFETKKGSWLRDRVGNDKGRAGKGAVKVCGVVSYVIYMDKTSR